MLHDEAGCKKGLPFAGRADFFPLQLAGLGIQAAKFAVTRDAEDSICIRDFNGLDDLIKSYDQVGIDDCSTDLSLRGLPVFRGLVGPIPEGKGVARYETPDAFEALTKDWAKTKVKRRRRKTTTTNPPHIPMAGPTIDTPSVLS